MIPKIIHYCWFGHNPLPPLAQQCIASWRRFMPEWVFVLNNKIKRRKYKIHDKK